MWELDFGKKILFRFFWPKTAPNGPKIRFFKFFEKLLPGIFLDFLHEVLNLLKYFYGQNLVLKFLDQKGPKRSQNEVSQVLWKIEAHDFSLFLY